MLVSLGPPRRSGLAPEGVMGGPGCIEVPYIMFFSSCVFVCFDKDKNINPEMSERVNQSCSYFLLPIVCGQELIEKKRFQVHLLQITQTKVVTLWGPQGKSANHRALCGLYCSGLHRKRSHVITLAVCGRLMLPGGHAAVCSVLSHWNQRVPAEISSIIQLELNSSTAAPLLPKALTPSSSSSSSRRVPHLRLVIA